MNAEEAKEVVHDQIEDPLPTGERLVPCFAKGTVLAGCLVSVVGLMRGDGGRGKSSAREALAGW